LLNEFSVTSFAITSVIAVAVLGLCVLLNARSATNLGRYVSLALLLVVIVSLPIWASFVLVAFGSFQFTGSDYWAVAPWIMIVAAIRYLNLSTLIAAITAALYFLVPGEHKRKLTVATVVSMALLGGAAWMANVERLDGKQAHRVSDKESNALKAFVTNAPELPEDVATAPVRAWVIRNINRDGLPVRYAVAVRSEMTSKGVVAIIDVDRSAGEPRFTWICTAERDLSDWERKDPCTSGY
jgi:hypothetical protein